MKFQSVRSLAVFVESNQDDEDATKLFKLQLLGTTWAPFLSPQPSALSLLAARCPRSVWTYPRACAGKMLLGQCRDTAGRAGQWDP